MILPQRIKESHLLYKAWWCSDQGVLERAHGSVGQSVAFGSVSSCTARVRAPFWPQLVNQCISRRADRSSSLPYGPWSKKGVQSYRDQINGQWRLSKIVKSSKELLSCRGEIRTCLPFILESNGLTVYSSGPVSFCYRDSQA